MSTLQDHPACIYVGDLLELLLTVHLAHLFGALLLWTADLHDPLYTSCCLQLQLVLLSMCVTCAHIIDRRASFALHAMHLLQRRFAALFPHAHRCTQCRATFRGISRAHQGRTALKVHEASPFSKVHLRWCLIHTIFSDSARIEKFTRWDLSLKFSSLDPRCNASWI